MNKALKLIFLLFACMVTTICSGQQSSTIPAQNKESFVCNKYGAWIWYLKLTRFKTHEALADTLASIGVKRIYIKVADGAVDFEKFPVISDPSVTQAYLSRGIEPWAWSYNYPNNEYDQGRALYLAAKNGYKGYVVDVEVQYNGKPHLASRLFRAFESAKKKAENENFIGINSFPIYCTTWGNPRTHNFPIATINQYVDAFMPQTYIENWGNEHLVTIEKTIDNVNDEYKYLGCTKPIHHIVSTEKGIITPQQVNRFISYAGEETSIWPVPGINTSMLLWGTWNNIDWDYDHCTTNRDEYIAKMRPDIKIHVYPKRNEILVGETVNSISIVNQTGNVVAQILNPANNIDISNLLKGRYIMEIIDAAGDKISKTFYKR
jgi:hypothetical protein